MNFIYSVLGSIIFLLVCFFLFKKITQTRYWRIRSNINAYNKEKKESKKLIENLVKQKEIFLSDDNKIIEILSKIHNGEEVEIPLVAFDYIYRKINKISTIDKNGNVKILSAKDFDDFKRTAIDLLGEEDRKKVIEENRIIESNNDTDIYTFKSYPNGTIIKKENLTGALEIITADMQDVLIKEPKKDETKDEKKNREGNNLVNLMQTFKKANQETILAINRTLREHHEEKFGLLKNDNDEKNIEKKIKNIVVEIAPENIENINEKMLKL